MSSKTFPLVAADVIAEEFIGRKSLMDKLLEYMTDRGNVNVIGLTRMGKTTLVQEALRRVAENPDVIRLKKPPLVVEATVTTRTGWDLFAMWADRMEEAVEDMMDELSDEQQPLPSDKMFRRKLAAVRKELDSSESKAGNGNFIPLCKEFYNLTGRFCWVVLDEMDHAGAGDFGLCVDDFRALVSSCPCARTINISINTLADIFSHSVHGSLYVGVVTQQIHVTGWSPADMDDFRARLQQRYPCLTEEQWQELRHCGGNVPYLLVLMANHLIGGASGSVRSYCDATDSPCMTTMEKWGQWLCRKGWIHHALRLQRKETLSAEELTDLETCGVAEDGVPSVPRFGEYLAERYTHEGMEREDLWPCYDRLQLEVEGLLAKIQDLLRTNVEIHYNDNLLGKINSYIDDMKAIHAKVTCMVTLRELGTFVKLLPDQAEYEGFSARVDEVLRVWEQYRSGG